MRRWIIIFSCLLLLFIIPQKWPLSAHQLQPARSKMPILTNLETRIATDSESLLHYFFHSHREAEAGHFHIFFKDVNSSTAHHIVGASINENGELIKLFVTAPWVTDEDPLPAKDLLERINTTDDSAGINPWIIRLLKAHSQDIEELLTFRDELRPTKFGRYEIIAEKAIQPSLHGSSVGIDQMDTRHQ